MIGSQIIFMPNENIQEQLCINTYVTLHTIQINTVR